MITERENYMSKRDELTKRLLKIPSDFTYGELQKVLNDYGFEEYTGGRTTGSAVKFLNEKTGEKIYIHKPHPGSIVKQYVLQEVARMIRRRR